MVFQKKEMRAIKPVVNLTEWITEQHKAFQDILDHGR